MFKLVKGKLAKGACSFLVIFVHAANLVFHKFLVWALIMSWYSLKAACKQIGGTGFLGCLRVIMDLDALEDRFAANS